MFIKNRGLYCGLLALIIAVNVAIIGILLSPTAFGVSNDEKKAELESSIAECVEIKDKAHQMAELARYFGCEETDVIILFAKTKWAEADNRQISLQIELDSLSSNPYDPYNLPPTTWTGPVLTKSKGVNQGPIGKETYYNLNMSGVVRIMRNKGYDEATYPYWVREDGCKMLGPYVMVAANFSHFPRGTVVECSRGWALVCDTGHLGYNQLDIAVNWV